MQAFDAAGNVSPRATVTASTTACPDTTPPTPPASFAVGTATTTAIVTSFAPSTDNVGLAGYTLYRDGVSVVTIPAASVATQQTINFTYAGLTCGTSYLLSVEAFDAAGNVSLRQSITGSTLACADSTPPTVSLTAPAAGATVSGAVRLTANATDAGGVASVQFAVDGANVGAPVTAAPYSVTWDSLGAANGTHTITARATDNAGNAATSAAVTVTVQNLLDTTNAFKKVDVGPGFMDAALHGVIRTPDGRVYIFAADDTAQRKATGPGVIHAYRAGQVGIPTSFTEADAVHRPSATGVTHVVGSPDVRLAANGIAHMVYTDETNATLWYQTFSTVTDTWGPRVSLATGVDIPAVAIKRETSNALALDANDVPHVVYAGGGVVQYRNRIGGAWSTPVTVSSGGTPIHVSLTAVPDGTLDLAWLQGAIAPSTIRFAQRSAAGAWSAPETVATGDVLDNSNADQGPSVAYSATFEPYVLYVSGLPASAVRVRHRAGGAWTLDPTPTDFFTHTPQIYMTGNDVYAFLGHDSQIRYAYAFHLAGQAWSPLTALTSTIDGTLDGSASVRFDPLHETNASVIDTTFWDEDQLNNKTYFPEAYYMAVLPSGAGGGTPPSSDATPPTVSMTAPASGGTVSGVVTLTASASDNVGVAGVQFKLDGANLGAEDTTGPAYSAGVGHDDCHERLAHADRGGARRGRERRDRDVGDGDRLERDVAAAPARNGAARQRGDGVECRFGYSRCGRGVQDDRCALRLGRAPARLHRRDVDRRTRDRRPLHEHRLRPPGDAAHERDDHRACRRPEQRGRRAGDVGDRRADLLARRPRDERDAQVPRPRSGRRRKLRVEPPDDADRHARDVDDRLVLHGWADLGGRRRLTLRRGVMGCGAGPPRRHRIP